TAVADDARPPTRRQQTSARRDSTEHEDRRKRRIAVRGKRDAHVVQHAAMTQVQVTDRLNTATRRGTEHRAHGATSSRCERTAARAAMCRMSVHTASAVASAPSPVPKWKRRSPRAKRYSYTTWPHGTASSDSRDTSS